MKKTFIILTAALFCFCACDVFTPEKLLEKTPQSKISPADFFSNETELQLYTNPLYDLFDNSLMYKRSSTDRFSDHFIENNLSDEQAGTRSAVETSWSWASLRRINSLLANSHNCSDEKVRLHYEGIARFFRAYFYFAKVIKWGDVPWIDHELDSDSEDLYAPRDTRETIYNHMIEDLDFAIENLPEGVSTYRLNKWAAQLGLTPATITNITAELIGAARAVISPDLTGGDYASRYTAHIRQFLIIQRTVIIVSSPAVDHRPALFLRADLFGRDTYICFDIKAVRSVIDLICITHTLISASELLFFDIENIFALISRKVIYIFSFRCCVAFFRRTFHCRRSHRF